MTITVLITGFGPYPGVRRNPTALLVRRLARLRRGRSRNIRVASHVFRTSYAAVDRELPKLVARHRPDALLMFGLAPKARTLRIETQAQNRLARLRDATGRWPGRRLIAPGAPPRLLLPASPGKLLAAARKARLPAVVSRDAGRYLCNYLCWRAAEAALQPRGPRLTAFVHVPAIPAQTSNRAGRTAARFTADTLTDAGLAMVAAVAAACDP